VEEWKAKWRFDKMCSAKSKQYRFAQVEAQAESAAEARSREMFAKFVHDEHAVAK